MRIGFLTPFRQANPYAEYAHNLTAALLRRGHEVFVVAPNGELIPGEESQEFRFEEPLTGSGVDSIVEFLKEKKIELLIVQSEVTTKYTLLEALVDRVNTFSKAYVIVHTDDYPELNYRVFARCLMPSATIPRNPMGCRGTLVFPQGIPHYTPMEDRYKFREELGFPGEDKMLLMAVEGKTDLNQLIAACTYINAKKGERPIELLLHTTKPFGIGSAIPDLANTHDFVHGSLGYIEQNKLIQYMDCADAFFMEYPQTVHRHTSSMIRLALASETAIITNKGSHTFDVFEFLPELDDGLSLATTVRRITNILYSAPFARQRQANNSKRAKRMLAWDKIVNALN